MLYTLHKLVYLRGDYTFMPIKVDVFDCINAKQRNNMLFKNAHTKMNNKCCYGKDIIVNSNFDTMHNLIIKVLDKANPLAQKYPSLYKLVLFLGEKMLKNDKNLKI